MKKTSKVVLALALVYSFTASFASAYTIEWDPFPPPYNEREYGGVFVVGGYDSNDSGYIFYTYSFRIMSDYGYSGYVNTSFLLALYLLAEVSAVSESGSGAHSALGFYAGWYLSGQEVPLSLNLLRADIDFNEFNVWSFSSEMVSDSLYITDSLNVTTPLEIGEWYDLNSYSVHWWEVYAPDNESMASYHLRCDYPLFDAKLPKEHRVPEPSTILLLGTGLGSLGLVSRRRKK